jgi:uracil-DNA glycosylase
MDIDQMFEGVDADWLRALLNEDLTMILESLPAENLAPSPEQIFTFAKLCAWKNIRVVIVGQDPYHNGSAHGLAFSSLGRKVPASLVNVFKCLEAKGLIGYPDSDAKESDWWYTPVKTPNLSYWASQGVLLINTALTTIRGTAYEHKAIWRKYVDRLLTKIADELEPIFILWGKPAQAKAKLIGACTRFAFSHPSPLSKIDFTPCTNFDDVNTLLERPIDWNTIPQHAIYTDGACANNGKGPLAKAGWAAVWARGPLRGLVRYGALPEAVIDGKVIYGSNNRGEGLAIIRAIEGCLVHRVRQRITIVTDSEFWKNMITVYMPKWAAADIDFATKKNSDLTTKMWGLIEKIRELGGELNVLWVASHGKDPDLPVWHTVGNALADKWAAAGEAQHMLLLEERIEI